MWTKEKQFETHKEIVKLCSDGNVFEHSQQLNFGLNKRWGSSSTVKSSLSLWNLSSDCQLSETVFKDDTAESVA